LFRQDNLLEQILFRTFKNAGAITNDRTAKTYKKQKNYENCFNYFHHIIYIFYACYTFDIGAGKCIARGRFVLF
jgi:hypothetical protein